MKQLATVQRMSPKDILTGLRVSTALKFARDGMSLSGLLEHMCPTEAGDNTGLDAYERVLMELNIVPRSMPEAGVWCDTWDEAFHGEPDSDEGKMRRLLGMEWMQRIWRGVTFASRMPNVSRRESTVLQSNDYTPGSWERPYADAQQYRLQQIQPAIPLSSLVAVTTPITGNVYRAVYIEDVDPKKKRYVRVSETAEVPRVVFKSAEREVNLFKYGRIIESSYEVLRRQRLDRIAVEIAMIAVQVENDKVATVLDVIVNGDGNSGTAAPTTNLTALDPATTANNPTLAAWIAFRLLFKNPYTLKALIAQQGPLTKAMLINTGSANIPLMVISGYLGLGQFTLMNSTLRDSVGYGISEDAPANRWIGIDTARAIERVYEVGANITEMERFTTKQTETLTMTEVEGYAILDKRAAHNVNLAA